MKQPEPSWWWGAVKQITCIVSVTGFENPNYNWNNIALDKDLSVIILTEYEVMSDLKSLTFAFSNWVQLHTKLGF